MAVSTMFGNGKKIIRFNILVFLEAQEIICKAIVEAVNVMNIVYFYKNLFTFNEKVLSPLDPVVFFRNIFYLNPC